MPSFCITHQSDAAVEASYVDGAQAGPDFAYLRGTRLPPEIAGSLEAMGRWRGALSAERRRRHFFGPGTEWAARFWPVPRTPGLPIYVHAGNSMGPAEASALLALVSSGEFQEITARFGGHAIGIPVLIGPVGIGTLLSQFLHRLQAGLQETTGIVPIFHFHDAGALTPQHRFVIGRDVGIDDGDEVQFQHLTEGSQCTGEIAGG